ncbi:hypothetical protein M8C21_018935, partial [Ambrosia artemisiifolia]
ERECVADHGGDFSVDAGDAFEEGRIVYPKKVYLFTYTKKQCVPLRKVSSPIRPAVGFQNLRANNEQYGGVNDQVNKARLIDMHMHLDGYSKAKMN